MSRAHFKGRLHECDGCYATIKRGDPYLAHSNLFEHTWSREKLCFACWLTREQFAEAHGQSFAPHMLRDQLQQCIDENDKRGDPWRPLLAALLRRRRLTRRGRLFWFHQKEGFRLFRARRSWALGPGCIPRSAA